MPGETDPRPLHQFRHGALQDLESTEAYARMNHILDSIGNQGGKLPTVVVTANDNQAVGVARALYEHGVRIPRDVSLVGFDDMPAMDNMIPPLTTVRPDFEALGVAAMRQVLHLLGKVTKWRCPRPHMVSVCSPQRS